MTTDSTPVLTTPAPGRRASLIDSSVMLQLNADQTSVFYSHGEPVLVLSREGFHYKGEMVEDAGRAYDCFMAVLRSAGCPMPALPEESSDDD